MVVEHFFSWCSFFLSSPTTLYYTAHCTVKLWLLPFARVYVVLCAGKLVWNVVKGRKYSPLSCVSFSVSLSVCNFIWFNTSTSFYWGFLSLDGATTCFSRQKKRMHNCLIFTYSLVVFVLFFLFLNYKHFFILL